MRRRRLVSVAEPGLKLTFNARVCTLDGYSLLLVIRRPPHIGKSHVVRREEYGAEVRRPGLSSGLPAGSATTWVC